MQKWKCHKIVEAFKIIVIREIAPDKFQLSGPFDEVTVIGSFLKQHSVRKNPEGPDYGYFVRYADGYVSWSPAKAFEEGYSELTANTAADGVPAADDTLNRHKALEMAVMLIRSMDVADHLKLARAAAENFYEFLTGMTKIEVKETPVRVDLTKQ